MPRQYTAQNIASISNLKFILKGEEVVGFSANAEVNYGEMGLTHDFDLWAEMDDTDRRRVQTLYNIVKRQLERLILG